MRGETFNCSASSFSTLFQSTPLMRGETPQHARDRRGGRISIHSPHARGDLWEADCPRVVVISIHSPHARGDGVKPIIWRVGSLFQSTPLMRGETSGQSICGKIPLFQSTPLMRGETGSWMSQEYASIPFQSTPLMRGETKAAHISSTWPRFQSTPLMRGETTLAGCTENYFDISIHSPHARGDKTHIAMHVAASISIHSPHARGDSINL